MSLGHDGDGGVGVAKQQVETRSKRENTQREASRCLRAAHGLAIGHCGLRIDTSASFAAVARHAGAAAADPHDGKAAAQRAGPRRVAVRHRKAPVVRQCHHGARGWERVGHGLLRRHVQQCCVVGALVRVLRGVLRGGEDVVDPRRRKVDRALQVERVHARERELVRVAVDAAGAHRLGGRGRDTLGHLVSRRLRNGDADGGENVVSIELQLQREARAVVVDVGAAAVARVVDGLARKGGKSHEAVGPRGAPQQHRRLADLRWGWLLVWGGVWHAIKQRRGVIRLPRRVINHRCGRVEARKHGNLVAQRRRGAARNKGGAERRQ
mmetsp:Transcript_17222/g.53478  ORF Transcript_17222/g.53478 Transcript_17222/m.53478 type:complete len:324 (-) Transcript_17222:335-1306(-)